MEYLKSITSPFLSPFSPKAIKQIPSQRIPRPKYIDRCVIFDHTINIFGYPSRGGFILLERADAIDFHFLNISRFDPPLNRATTQEAEDKFCQRLLLLGAKWFDSQSRIQFMVGLKENNARCLRDLENSKIPELVLGERQWVKAGWPTQGRGLWVGEWDTTLPGILEDEVVPGDAARVTLALNMDERCDILKGMGAKFYKSLEEYNGNTYLRAWETKWEGEVEPLQQTWEKN